MRQFAFHHIDVFTEVPFEGNPLAVFTDGRGLDQPTMQRIAREMNLSETVFIEPPRTPGAAATLRIFTPAAELPFAGHPTVGAAFVLHATGAVAPQQRAFVLDEGIGPVPVRIDDGATFTAWLRTPPLTFAARFDDRAAIAAALGLEPADIREDAPVQAVSAGNPFVFAALRDERAVDRCDVDPRALRNAIGTNVNGIYVFATRASGVYSRMFAPQHGIAEDPATGSATGPLAAYALEYGLIPSSDRVELVAEQGTHMGRRSVLRILVSGHGTGRTIEVGGSAVALMEGTLSLPDAR